MDVFLVWFFIPIFNNAIEIVKKNEKRGRIYYVACARGIPAGVKTPPVIYQVRLSDACLSLIITGHHLQAANTKLHEHFQDFISIFLAVLRFSSQDVKFKS